MTIHVGELTTELIAESPPPPSPAREGSRWEEIARVRALARRIQRDQQRTHAAGYDD